MKKTYLLCLANSRKYGERCIAGIELLPRKNGFFYPRMCGGRPRWIRPVTAAAHGQVPTSLVRNVCVGDILEIIAVEACPKGYQSENVLFKKRSIRVVRPARLTCRQLQALVEDNGRYLFGNSGNYLDEEEITPVTRSLILVKAQQPQAYFCTPYNTKPRLKFCCRDNWYNFPVTDVNFIDRMQEDPSLLEGRSEMFLAVSLGVGFQGRYYKLAAGVLLV